MAGHQPSKAETTPDAAWLAMKRYVRFDEADAKRLVAVLPVVEPHFVEIAESFYDRTRDHERAHAVFVDEAQIDRLKSSLVGWMYRIFGGVYDGAHFERTSRIGDVHLRIGLPQRFMVLGMAVLRDALVGAIAAAPPADLGPTLQSVHRILDLELTVMLDSYVESIRDRAEEAISDRALSISARELEAAIGLVDVIVVGLDHEGKITSANAELERLTGRARTDLVGRAFTKELVPEPLVDELSRALARAKVDHGGRVLLEASGVRARGGKVREVRWQIVHPPRERPAPPERATVYLIGRDISEERELGERMRRAERLATVGTLAAGLAHEIRNPLNGAQLHLTFLERQLAGHKLSDREVDDALGVVRREILRLSNLVTEFLDFARPHPLDRREVDVREVCQDVAALAGPEAELARVELAVDLPRSELPAQVDPAKLSQVMVNLVRNAVEATASQGSGTVVIRARRKPRTVLVEVEDDGPGLPASLPVFDPFFTTKATGSGLGLSIAHRIIADHDGTLSFESVPGRTVFRITLPLASAGQGPEVP